MSRFVYRAYDADGKIVQGTLDYESKDEVIKSLHIKGLYPTQITKEEQSSKKISQRELLTLTQSLSNLLSSGLPVDEALFTLKDSVSDRAKPLVTDIRRAVQGGMSLSEALGKHPHVFSPYYIFMVKAGEESGILEKMAQRLTKTLEHEEEVAGYIRSSLVYPSTMAFLGLISVIVLFAFVIPRFNMIFNMLSGQVPKITEVLLDISVLVSENVYIIFILLSVFVLGSYVFFKTDDGQEALYNMSMKIPVMSTLKKKILTANILSTISTMLKSGVPLSYSLMVVVDIANIRSVKKDLEIIHRRVKEGESFGDAIYQSKLFLPMTASVIKAAEKSGDLSKATEKLAKLYEGDSKNMIKVLLSFVEPAIILAMAIFVLFIVMAILIPMLSLNELLF